MVNVSSKKATAEENISDFEISCQFGSWNLDDKYIKIEKNDDDKRVNKEATAEKNVFNFEISCQFSLWHLNEKYIKMDTNDDDRRVNKEETKGIMKYHANLVHGIKPRNILR